MELGVTGVMVGVQVNAVVGAPKVEVMEGVTVIVGVADGVWGLEVGDGRIGVTDGTGVGVGKFAMVSAI